MKIPNKKDNIKNLHETFIFHNEIRIESALKVARNKKRKNFLIWIPFN